MGSKRSFADPDTHFRIVEAGPGDHDGYQVGEPKRLECLACVAGITLTHEPSTSVDEMDHNAVDGEPCPQADVGSK